MVRIKPMSAEEKVRDVIAAVVWMLIPTCNLHQVLTCTLPTSISSWRLSQSSEKYLVSTFYTFCSFQMRTNSIDVKPRRTESTT